MDLRKKIPGISYCDQLCNASRTGNIKAMEQLINSGTNVNCLDGTPLLLAGRYGQLEAAKCLVAYGAYIDRSFYPIMIEGSIDELASLKVVEYLMHVNRK